MLIQEWLLNPLEYLVENVQFLVLGIVTLIFVIVTLIVSGRMIYQGIKLKVSTFSYVGIEYIGVASCWFGVALNFVSILLFNTVPAWELHFIAHGGILTIAQIFWVFAMTKLLPIKEKYHKKIQIAAIIIGLIVEITYIIIIFTNQSWLGIPVAPIQIVYGPFSYIYLMAQLLVFTFFGFWFVIESLKSANPKVKLKGKFLALSFSLFTFASFLEVFFTEIWVFIIARLIIMSSAFLFYIGFMLPEQIEKIFLK
ncbi:MAG: hypothetical protein EU550_03310 [Promethearchaeota archaeon]|nr:MAG: hypothetical protein EU550_03310 [Candidatus Lokiarchaeota archaeon]